MSVVGYVRVSTVGQVDGNGLDVQRERIAAWSAYQGLALTVVEEDAGVSGASTDGRDGFKRAIKRVLESGTGATLVVYKLDRLGRSALDVQETIAVLLDAGVRVVALADGIDSASGMGATLLKLLTSILASFAELEREAIRTRLLDGRKRAKATGKKYSREAHYGLRQTEEGALVEDALEQRTVARARELRAQGLTLRAIGAQLVSEGFKPRRAAAWQPCVIARMVSGERPASRGKRASRIVKARAEFLAA